MPETPAPLDLDALATAEAEEAPGPLQALAVQWDAQAAHNADQGGDFWKGMVTKGRECADDLRRSLAVIRDHQPVKPGREDIYRAWHGTDEPWGGCADSARIERVLALWPGNSKVTAKPDREGALKRVYRDRQSPLQEEDVWAFGEGVRAGIDAVLDLWPGRSEATVKGEAVAEVIEFLDSQVGPDEIVGYVHLAARSIQWWQDARADHIKKEK